MEAVIQLHTQTPLLESQVVSQKAGLKVFLKLENLQPTASFKIRGIGNLCTKAKQEGVKHFVSSSGGNAGYAAAYAGNKLSIPTTVFVPKTTKDYVIDIIKKQNAIVEIIGNVWDETHQHASEFARKINGLYISPFDHPLIWEGHATLVDELALEISRPDAVIVAVGGGGLLCGVIEGLHKNSWHDVPVIAVETLGADSFAAALKAGHLVTLDEISSVAKSLGAKTVAQEAFNWSKKHSIQSVVVTDQEASSACLNFYKDHGYKVEPACGAALAVAYSHSNILKDMKSIVVIVCGGIAIN